MCIVISYDTDEEFSHFFRHSVQLFIIFVSVSIHLLAVVLKKFRHSLGNKQPSARATAHT